MAAAINTTRHFTVSTSSSAQSDKDSPFAPNSIYTTKYNILTFFPKFFLEQFAKTSNSLFLVTSSLQQIKGLTPTNRFATSLGLGFVLSVSAMKELWEDWRRRQADVRANRSETRVVDCAVQRCDKMTWAQVKVGEVLEVHGGEEAPADLIVLATSEPGGLCYVETANIDGETNLKIRCALFPGGVDLGEIGGGAMECEQPNSRIDGFEGVLTDRKGRKHPITKEQLLIRGARLRNTGWIRGIVVYTGKETKIMMNTGERAVKVTRMESIYNQQSVILFLFLLSCILFHFLKCRQYELQVLPAHLYIQLEVDWNRTMDILYRFIVFCLLYHNIVPINLNITVEMVRLLLGVDISSDPELTDDPGEDPGCEPDEEEEEQEMPTVCRTSTLVEELGQVRFVFSDKTGTLTRNQMRLKHLAFCNKICLAIDASCSPHIEDTSHGDGQESRDALHFFRMLSICHTVVIDQLHRGSQTRYQASSPDEAAIVAGIQATGWAFVNRDLHRIYISAPGKRESFELLQVLEFSSERRRMSVIVRDGSGDVWLYTKGADDVLFSAELCEAGPYDEQLKEALDMFGRDGMRTLCFGYRLVPNEEYNAWAAEYVDAMNSVTDRTARVDTVTKRIERGWQVVGVTAVEDRLQDRVPETIRMLREAGMSIWVLTGDRRETAMNIGYSCGLIDPGVRVAYIDSCHDIKQLTDRPKKYCLVIDGAVVEQALSRSASDFISLAMSAEAVLCCRTSPQQKAAVVTAVKAANRGVTLAIGDGANDVSMIRAAHIGVGLCGREGVQAARSADFALRRFAMLQRLLLVHGCYSYQRLSKVFTFCLYKNFMLYAAQFWYSQHAGFSGQSMYDGWFLSLYNLVFTAVPIGVLGATEQYVQPDKLLEHPGLYRTGPADRFFNWRSYWATALNSVFQSFLIANLVIWAHSPDVVTVDNKPAGLWHIGSTIFAVGVVTVTLKVFILANYWTWLLIGTSIAGPASWFLYTFVADQLSLKMRRCMLIGGISVPLFSSPVFWACVLLGPVVCLSRDFLWKFYKRSYSPLGYHIIQEMEVMERKAMEARSVAPSTDEQAKVHGFAFSQTEGQTRILAQSIPFLQDPFRLIGDLDWP